MCLLKGSQVAEEYQEQNAREWVLPCALRNKDSFESKHETILSNHVYGIRRMRQGSHGATNKEFILLVCVGGWGGAHI